MKLTDLKKKNKIFTSPMLAGQVELSNLSFPQLVTPKFDGIRCLTLPPDTTSNDLFAPKTQCRAVTRKWMPIPNKHIRDWIEQNLPPGLDGELMLVDNRASFQRVSSAVSSASGCPSFVYHVFDYVARSIEEPYTVRLSDLFSVSTTWSDDWPVRTVYPKVIGSLDTLFTYESDVLKLGFEGLMLRTPESPYKCGRSTTNQGWLLKLKRTCDSEAVIVQFEEGMKNNNVKKSDNFGKAKRSTNKENLVGLGRLGALVCSSDEWPGVTFNIGTGFDEETRKTIWKNRDQYFGKTVKYKYQKIGSLVRPRCPVFLGFRFEGDMP